MIESKYGNTAFSRLLRLNTMRFFLFLFVILSVNTAAAQDKVQSMPKRVLTTDLSEGVVLMPDINLPVHFTEEEEPATTEIQVLDRIEFAPGTLIVTKGLEILDLVASLIKANPRLRINVEVWVADSGNDRVDYKMSQKRAEKLMRMFDTRGVRRHRAIPVGRGASRLEMGDYVDFTVRR